MNAVCVSDFESLERSFSKHNINYCFFSQTSEPQQVRAATQAIRFHKDDAVRFSPTILMAKEISRQELGGYISIGFDDIVQYPCTFGTLRTRIKRQLNNVIKYYETAEYFGPDRRNYFVSQSPNHVKRTGLAPYKCISIRRDIFKGVEIVNLFDHRPQAFTDAKWDAV